MKSHLGSCLPVVSAPRYRVFTPLLGLLLGVACTGDPVETTDTTTLPESPVWVSSPFHAVHVAQAPESVDVVWVSMMPGTIPDGLIFSIENMKSQVASASYSLVHGGLDPVRIPAEAGDTLLATITRQGAPSRNDSILVPVRSRLHLVRVAPANQDAGLPLDARVLLVFSQPVQWSTLALGVHLTLNDAEVVGTFAAIAGPGDTLFAEFVPASALQPNATYKVAVSSQVLDRNGLALELPVSQSFTTGTRASLDEAPDVQIVSPTGGATFSPDWATLTVTATDDHQLVELDLNLIAGPGVSAPRGFAVLPESTSYSSRVYLVSSYSARLGYGTYTWQAVATDTHGNRTESAPGMLTIAPPEPGQLLVVDTASIIEYTRTAAGPVLLYSPQLEVTVPPGAGTLQLLTYRLLAIGGIQDGEILCGTGNIPEGEAQDILSSRGGRYDYTTYFYYWLDGASLVGKNATAQLVYRDTQGRNYVLNLDVPFVAETAPPRASRPGKAGCPKVTYPDNFFSLGVQAGRH